MNKYLDILNDVLRLATFQPPKRYRDNGRSENWPDDVPTRFRYERRGGERFYG